MIGVNPDYNEVFKTFPSHDNATRATLTEVYLKILSVYYVFLDIETYISILGFFLTIFHLIILTRKSMRTTSIMSIMIVAALFDLVSMAIAVGIQDLIDNMVVKECSPPNTFLAMQIYGSLQSIRDDVVRCSTWLSVLMALVRCAMLKLAGVPGNCNKISKFSFGVKISGVVLAISTMISIGYLLRGKIIKIGEWKPAEHCPEKSARSVPIYDVMVSDLFNANDELILRVYMVGNGAVSKILPCILLPILTGILISELKRAREKLKHSKAKKKSSDRTTALVVFMTASYFIGLLPTGLMSFVTAVYTDQGFVFLTALIDHICYTLLTIDAVLHIPICFAMSSLYRITVCKVLRIRKKNIISPKNTAVSSVVQTIRLT